jgi:hypothetical protein
VSDIIDYNVGLLNVNDLTNSYFCLSKADPTAGFSFNASQLAGHAYPKESNDTSGKLRHAFDAPPHMPYMTIGTCCQILSRVVLTLSSMR